MPGKFPICTTFGFWLLLALLCMMLPLPWVAAMVLSSTVHELGHILALQWAGVPIIRLQLRADGANLETGELSPIQGVICALAGPLGALSLLLVSRWMPRTTVCAVIQSCYHLMPAAPFDGGRALNSLTELDSSGRWNWISWAGEMLVTILVLGLGIWLTFRTKLGVLPMILSVGVIFRILREKYLAKRDRKGYNIPNS